MSIICVEIHSLAKWAGVVGASPRICQTYARRFGEMPDGMRSSLFISSGDNKNGLKRSSMGGVFILREANSAEEMQ